MIRTGLFAAFLLGTCFVLATPAADVKPEATLKGHTEPVRGVAFTADGKNVVSVAYKEIFLWDLAERDKSQKYTGFQQMEYTWGTPRISANGRLVAVGGTYYASNNYTSSVRLHRITNKVEPAGELGPTTADDYEHDTVSETAFSPTSPRVAAVFHNAGKKKYTLGLYDAESRQTNNDKVYTSDTPLKIAFTPDGKTLVTADAKGNVILWGATNARQRASHEIHKSAINDLAIDPDSKTLATASDDKSVKLWDLDKGELKKELTGHEDGVLCVAYSRDGKYLASGGKDHNVKIWNAASGKELATIEAHLNTVTCLAFSPDGRTLVTGSADKEVRLWDVADALKAKADK
jgi:WD40 repeat protein